MNSQQPISHTPDDEIDLIGLIAAIWKHRWIVAGTMIACVAAAILYLNVATYKYTAELKVMPAQSGATGGNAGSLASLASVAGIKVSAGEGVQPFEQYLEGLKSGLAAELLVDHPNILKVVFAAEWDEAGQRFVERKGKIGSVARSIKHLLGIPVYPWQAPDSERLQAYIKKNVQITESAKTQFITVSFSHKDPQFAQQFLLLLHKQLDESLRKKALERSSKYIDYLMSQLERTTVAEHREALIRSLSEQEKFRMMASSRLAYAADPFGNVTVSSQPTSPRPVIVLALSVILGIILGSLVALILAWIRSQTPNQPEVGSLED